MAIQMRRGVKSDFSPSRMLPGEWAVVVSGDSATQDGKSVYICFSAGDVKRLTTIEDVNIAVQNIIPSVVSQAACSIQVGTVTTGDTAIIVNRGTTRNAVFDFTIPRGPQGPQGPAGPTTITVGEVITGEPGTNASVENVGTSENVILKFTIPRGASGTFPTPTQADNGKILQVVNGVPTWVTVQTVEGGYF